MPRDPSFRPEPIGVTKEPLISKYREEAHSDVAADRQGQCIVVRTNSRTGKLALPPVSPTGTRKHSHHLVNHSPKIYA